MKKQIVSTIESNFGPDIDVYLNDDQPQLILSADKVHCYELLSFLKENGFKHLSDVTCVDYLSEEEFEVIYHLFSYSVKVRAIVYVRIPRKTPKIPYILYGKEQLSMRGRTGSCSE